MLHLDLRPPIQSRSPGGRDWIGPNNLGQVGGLMHSLYEGHQRLQFWCILVGPFFVASGLLAGIPIDIAAFNGCQLKPSTLKRHDAFNHL